MLNGTILEASVELLSHTARQVYNLAQEGKSRPQIATRLNVTRQRISQIVKMLHRKEILDPAVLPENQNMTRPNWRVVAFEPKQKKGPSVSWLLKRRKGA